MHGRWILGLALSLALLPATAQAAVVGGSLEDPQGDSSSGAGTDIVRAAWSFDSEAGRLSVSVTFAAAPTGSDWGAINASLRDNSAPDCGGMEFARLRGNNNTSSASASVGNAADGQQPDGSTGPSIAPASNVKSDDGRTTTMEITHARLVGRTAACMHVNISHNGVLDSMAPIPVGATQQNPGGTPPPVVGPPTGTPPPGTEPTGSPADVRLASGRRLRFTRGAARVTLTGVGKGMTGRVRVATTGGTTIASAKYTATSSAPLKLELFLTRKGGRWLRRHRQGTARLTLTSTRGSTAVRRYRVRIV